jgi:hypothetical protein
MLLKDSVDFEMLVKRENKKGQGFGGKSNGAEVTWENPVELENYITEIQSAANNLMEKNRKIR